MHGPALHIGQHLLKTCDRLVLDLNQQKRFILKYLYMVDQHISQRKEGDKSVIDEGHLAALIETLGKVVSLEFMKHCTMGEVRIMFYSIWNVSYEAKNFRMFKECQLMLK